MNTRDEQIEFIRTNGRPHRRLRLVDKTVTSTGAGASFA
jgi:hypothetical protein